MSRFVLARGDRAPAFTAETTDGTRSLDELLADGPLVLVFYVEDATPACTAQLGAFRDDYATVRELGATVLAVSADGMESHRAFADRAVLPFPLAADADLAIARAYGVVNLDDPQRTRRAVFVIGADGAILDARVPYQPSVGEQFAAMFGALGVG